MARRVLRIITILLLVCAVVPAVHAQEGVSKKQQDKIQAKKAKTDSKEVKKEEKRIAKKHLANQDKATRKRMKRHKRRAQKQGNTGHRDPFLRRLFHSKH